MPTPMGKPSLLIGLDGAIQMKWIGLDKPDQEWFVMPVVRSFPTLAGVDVAGAVPVVDRRFRYRGQTNQYAIWEEEA